MQCKMKYFWHAQRDSDNYVTPHKHQCYELVYYKFGCGVSQIGSEKQEYSDNSIAFFQPGTVHDETHWNNSDITCVGFELKDFTIDLASDIYPLGEDKTVCRLSREMLEEMREQKLNYQAMLSLKISETLLLLSRLKAKPERTCKDLNYIINYIRENYDQKIKLSDMANVCGYSYSHFRHQFKIKTGVSPQDFLILRRLEEANKMLQSSDLSLTDISFLCGFSNSAQFSSMFKKQYGLSPLKARRAGK